MVDGKRSLSGHLSLAVSTFTAHCIARDRTSGAGAIREGPSIELQGRCWASSWRVQCEDFNRPMASFAPRCLDAVQREGGEKSVPCRKGLAPPPIYWDALRSQQSSNARRRHRTLGRGGRKEHSRCSSAEVATNHRKDVDGVPSHHAAGGLPGQKQLSVDRLSGAADTLKGAAEASSNGFPTPVRGRLPIA